MNEVPLLYLCCIDHHVDLVRFPCTFFSKLVQDIVHDMSCFAAGMCNMVFKHPLWFVVDEFENLVSLIHHMVSINDSDISAWLLLVPLDIFRNMECHQSISSNIPFSNNKLSPLTLKAFCNYHISLSYVKPISGFQLQDQRLWVNKCRYWHFVCSSGIWRKYTIALCLLSHAWVWKRRDLGRGIQSCGYHGP